MPKEKVDRTSAGLRSALFDALDDLRAGKVSASHASAIAGLAGQIVNTTKLEMVYQRFMSSGEEGKRRLPQIELGIIETP